MSSVRRPSFRLRLVLILLTFAVVPALLVTLVWLGTASRTLALADAGAAWDRVGRSGDAVLSTIDRDALDSLARDALDQHERELRQSVELGKRAGFVAARTVRVVAVVAVLLFAVVAWGASRVAGHLGRQLSRPLDELVGWTGRIRAGQPLPETAEGRGAPEFAVLRDDMRTMADELEASRRQALANERAEAYRESARRFAHELKNPLTPIRFAVDRLRRAATTDLPPAVHDTIDVLAEETARLETMARSFAQFGRLPDGPPAAVDVAELVTRFVPPAVPAHVALTLDLAPDLPWVHGHHDALARALGNVVGNAVDVMTTGGELAVRVAPDADGTLVIAVRDSGPGMSADLRARIFEPYVTTKPGGTGLGLAIVQQTIAAHGGVVEVESTEGVGTEVRLRLPIRPEVAVPRAADARASASSPVPSSTASSAARS